MAKDLSGFMQGLKKMADVMKATGKMTLAFPHLIGCGMAAGDWVIYEKMIVDFSRLIPSAKIFIIKLKK